LGPGNSAKGLKYSLYIDNAKKYATNAANARLKNEYISTVTRGVDVIKECIASSKEPGESELN